MSLGPPGRSTQPRVRAGFDSAATITMSAVEPPTPVRLDLSRHAVVRGHTVIPLSVREVEALALLAAEPGRVVRRSELTTAIWGDDPPSGARALDMVIRRIREKLGPGGDAIRSVRGAGFVLVSHPSLEVTTRPA